MTTLERPEEEVEGEEVEFEKLFEIHPDIERVLNKKKEEPNPLGSPPSSLLNFDFDENKFPVTYNIGVSPLKATEGRRKSQTNEDVPVMPVFDLDKNEEEEEDFKKPVSESKTIKYIFPKVDTTETRIEEERNGENDFSEQRDSSAFGIVSLQESENVENIYPSVPSFVDAYDEEALDSPMLLEKQIFEFSLNTMELLVFDYKVRPSHTFVGDEEKLLQETSSSRTERGDLFQWMIEGYQNSCLLIMNLLNKVDDLLGEVKMLESELFIFEDHKTTSPKVKCGDDRLLTCDVRSKLVQFSEEGRRRLAMKLNEIRDMRYKQLAALYFESRSWKKKIEYFIDYGLIRNSLFLNISKKSSEFSVRSEKDNIFMTRVRSCIKILFAFNKQRKYSEIKTKQTEKIFTFYEDIRKWVRQIVSYFIRCSDVNDHRFLIFELIQCRGIGNWGGDLLQLPKIVDEKGINFFIATLSAFLNPNIFDQNRIILVEDDYLTLWSQFPFIQVIDYLIIASKLDNINRYSIFKDWKATFDTFETIIFVLDRSISAFNIPSYREFARQIAHMIVRIIKMMFAVLDGLKYLENKKISFYYNKLFLKSFMSIFRMKATELNLWYFLSQLPYDSIIGENTYSCFLHLFFVQDRDWRTILRRMEIRMKEEEEEDGEMDNFNSGSGKGIFTLLKGIQNVDQWGDFMSKKTASRANFCGFLEKNIPTSSFIIHTLSQMAITSKSFSISMVILFEMFFLLLQMNKKTSQRVHRKRSMILDLSAPPIDEDFGKAKQVDNSHLVFEVINGIGIICQRFGNPCISMVLRLISSNFEGIRSSVTPILKQIPVSSWSPDKKDLESVDFLLSHPANSAQVASATLILYKMRIGIAPAPVQTRILNCVVTAYLRMQRDLEMKRKQKSIFESLRNEFDAIDRFRKFLWNFTFQHSLIGHSGVPYLKPRDLEHKSLNSLISIMDGSNGKKEFDGICAYYLLLFSNIGYNADLFVERGKKWIDLLIYWKQHEYAIRIMTEFTTTIIHSIKVGNFKKKMEEEEEDDDDDGIRSVSFLENIVNIFYCTDSYFDTIGGLIGARTITSKTKLLVQTIIFFIHRLNKESSESSMRYAQFWVEQFIAVYKSNRTSQCLFCLDEICKLCLSLKHSISEVFLEHEEFMEISLLKRGMFSFINTDLLAFKRKSIKPEVSYPNLCLTVFIGLVNNGFKKRCDFFLNNLKPNVKRKNDQLRTIYDEGSDFVIYRLIGHVLEYIDLVRDNIKEENAGFLDIHNYFILYWQLFFKLYFESYVDDEDPGKSRIFHGPLFLALTKRNTVMNMLGEGLTSLSEIYADALSSINLEEKKLRSSGNENVRKMEILQTKIENYQHLSTIYLAMSKWIKEEFRVLIVKYGRSELVDSYAPIPLQSLIGAPNFDLWYYMVDLTNIYSRIEKETENIISVIFPNISLSGRVSKSLHTKPHTPKLSQLNVFNQIRNDELKHMHPVPPLTKSLSSNDLLSKIRPVSANKFPWLEKLLLFQQNLQNFGSRAEQFDNVFLQQVPSLWSMQYKLSQNQEIRCFRSAFCKYPAKVSFYYQDAVMNRNIEAELIKNRKSSSDYFSSLDKQIMDMSDPFIYYLILMEKSIDIMIPKKPDYLNEGRNWFYTLMNLMEKSSSFAPHIVASIQRMLDRLGKEYIMKSPTETLRIFEILLRPDLSSDAVSRYLRFFKPQPNQYMIFLEVFVLNYQKVSETVMKLIFSRMNIDSFIEMDISDFESKRKLSRFLFLVIIDVTRDRDRSSGKSRALVAYFSNFWVSCILKRNPLNVHGKLLIDAFQMLGENILEIPENLLSLFNQVMKERKSELVLSEFFNQRIFIENLTHVLNRTLFETRRKHNFDCLYNLIDVGSTASDKLGKIRILYGIIFNDLVVITANTNLLALKLVFQNLCSAYSPFLLTEYVEKKMRKNQGSLVASELSNEHSSSVSYNLSGSSLSPVRNSTNVDSRNQILVHPFNSERNLNAYQGFLKDFMKSIQNFQMRSRKQDILGLLLFLFFSQIEVTTSPCIQTMSTMMISPILDWTDVDHVIVEKHVNQFRLLVELYSRRSLKGGDSTLNFIVLIFRKIRWAEVFVRVRGDDINSNFLENLALIFIGLKSVGKIDSNNQSGWTSLQEQRFIDALPWELLSVKTFTQLLNYIDQFFSGLKSFKDSFFDSMISLFIRRCSSENNFENTGGVQIENSGIPLLGGEDLKENNLLKKLEIVFDWLSKKILQSQERKGSFIFRNRVNFMKWMTERSLSENLGILVKLFCLAYNIRNDEPLRRRFGESFDAVYLPSCSKSNIGNVHELPEKYLIFTVLRSFLTVKDIYYVEKILLYYLVNYGNSFWSRGLLTMIDNAIFPVVIEKDENGRLCGRSISLFGENVQKGVSICVDEGNILVVFLFFYFEERRGKRIVQMSSFINNVKLLNILEISGSERRVIPLWIFFLKSLKREKESGRDVSPDLSNFVEYLSEKVLGGTNRGIRSILGGKGSETAWMNQKFRQLIRCFLLFLYISGFLKIEKKDNNMRYYMNILKRDQKSKMSEQNKSIRGENLVGNLILDFEEFRSKSKNISKEEFERILSSKYSCDVNFEDFVEVFCFMVRTIYGEQWMMGPEGWL